jgi:hypothetical protein
MSNNSEIRRGNWSETFTGKKFWTMDPAPEDICIEDIAHALSLICRYGGHSKHFYSVAQHSINVSRVLCEDGFNERIQLYGLLHDASEAYICDIPRPLKEQIHGYIQYEDMIQAVVYFHFYIGQPDKYITDLVKYVDDLVLYNEAKILMNNTDGWVKPVRTVKIDIDSRNPCDVERDFINLAESLLKCD